MKIIIAGMDIGFGQVKVCLKHHQSMIQTLCFPRIFAEAKNQNWGLNTHPIFGIEGDRFYVGGEALSFPDSFIRHDYRDYVKDKTYWLCICKALIDSGIFHDKDNVRIKRLILGLAPGHYSRDNITHMKRKALEGVEFVVNDTFYRFSVENVKILPQGSGAFFAETLTDSGLTKEKSSHKKLYGILDVGYRTTDFLIFEKGQFVSEKEELSEDTGMRTVLENLQSHIKKNYGKEELELLEPLLRGKPYEFRGDQYDFKSVAAQYIAEHIRKRIEPEVLKRWENRINRIYKIIICGGGAHFFKSTTDFLKDHQKQILIPDQPEMVNAIGFYRYGAMQETLKINKIKNSTTERFYG